MADLHGPIGPEPASEDFGLDVVGIGALNLDYIVDTSAAARPGSASIAARLSRLVESDGGPLEWGTERQVDGQTVHEAIQVFSSVRPDTQLGGSAFNAIHAIARAQLGLRLGFVGVAGRVPVFGVSAIREFEALGIDRQCVYEDDEHLCGICFSVSENGDRTLLTHAGANEYMADYLTQHFDIIVAYLSRARVIHVTSFLDDRTAGELLRVLDAVRKVNQATLICFDPGHVWSVETTPDIEAILHLSDFLLVNVREFHELGRRVDGESDEDVAARLLGRLTRPRSFVILKRADGIWAYRRDNGKVAADFYPQAQLSRDRVEDATGAGDVFAAGLLIVLTSDSLRVELGALLGMSLTRHKLRHVGTAGHAQFAEIAYNLLDPLTASRGASPRGVFIAHGANPEWLAVERFIEERFQLPVYSFESSTWGGRAVTDALADYLDRCDVAICVLTAEDFTGDGKRLARQNVIHEVGLFQGRHGFDKVLVLAEEGCDFVPESAAPNAIQFPRNGVGKAFYQVDAMIRLHYLRDTP